jgi:tRNA(Ile)-lysidine synthase
MDFGPPQLLATLRRLPPAYRYWVGFSGGLDSHVLLYAMAALRPALAPGEVRAVHVNHGLSPHAGAWANHCLAECARLEVPCRVLTVDARPRRGEGPEAAAREARYGAIAAFLAPGDCLVTAHHQDDQAETVLLQLLRGAGPHGMAGMPEQVLLGAGVHIRPLLAYPRRVLHRYATANSMHWIEDESNRNVNLERNFLRHEILPRLQEHWPAAARTLDRAAAHYREAALLLDGMAAEDLHRAGTSDPRALSLTQLAGLGAARARNVIRYWLKRLGLPLPGTEHMHQIERQLFTASPDRSPRVCWPGVEMRRYRDRVYAFAPAPVDHRNAGRAWDLTRDVSVPAGGGILSAHQEIGAGVSAELCYSHDVAVSFRQGGERCRPVGSPHSRTLKNLFQERGIPPWERERVPLVFIGGLLAAVADYWICHPFAAEPHERGIVFHWSGPDARR